MQPNLTLAPVFDKLAPSSTLEVNETVNKLWSQGKTVFHMGFGESRFDVHPKLKQALIDHADKKSYPAARGLPELTQAVARYYSHKLNLDYASEQVIIGPGSKALIYSLQAVLDADVFLPTPSWVSYGPQAQLLGRQYHYIPSRPELGYKLEISELDKLVAASSNPCKLLILNSPNNPTGQVLCEADLIELADYCRSRNIWVLSDEIYFEVCHGNTPHKSIASFYPEGTFVLGGLSKHLSIGGWRLGVGLVPNTALGKQVLNKLTVMASELWSGVSAPIQYAAIKAYSMDPEIEQYVDDCCAIHGIRTRFIADALSDMGLMCTEPEGAFYITVNFDRYRTALLRLGIENSSQLCKYLLNEYSIATLAGSDFGIPEKTQSLRLSTSYLDIETEFDAQRLLSLYRSRLSVKTFMSEEHHPSTHGALNAFKCFVESLK